MRGRRQTTREVIETEVNGQGKEKRGSRGGGNREEKKKQGERQLVDETKHNAKKRDEKKQKKKRSRSKDTGSSHVVRFPSKKREKKRRKGLSYVTPSLRMKKRKKHMRLANHVKEEDLIEHGNCIQLNHAVQRISRGWSKLSRLLGGFPYCLHEKL